MQTYALNQGLACGKYSLMLPLSKMNLSNEMNLKSPREIFWRNLAPVTLSRTFMFTNNTDKTIRWGVGEFEVVIKITVSSK